MTVRECPSRAAQWLVAGALVAFLGAAPIRAAAGDETRGRPQRIASLNLCTDQLLLALGVRKRLVSLTFLAADPASSPMAERARGLPTNRGRAEEILPLEPDLVLAGATAATPTVDLLERLGYRVVVVPLARSLDDIPAHIATVARAVGEEVRGREMIARFRRELSALRAQVASASEASPLPVALLFGPNGVTSGAGTLAGAAIEAAGYRNGAAGTGLSGVGRIPLEAALGLDPDLLILSGLRGDSPSLATATLEHPALRHAFRGRARIRIQHHLWACGTPTVLAAIRLLADARPGTAVPEGTQGP